MDWQAWVSILVVAVSLLLLALSRIPSHLVMMGALTVLSVSGILEPSEALAGFSNSGLITVAAMFVVAAAIHASGGVDLLVEQLLGRPVSVRRAIARVIFPVIGLSGFLNNTPLVAAMIPALNVWARRIQIPVAKLMIPLSFAAILGGTITLIGTSTNLVVNSQYQSLAGLEGFSLFAITPVGLMVAFAGMILMIWKYPVWLPDADPDSQFADLREFTLEVAIAENGPLVGKSVAAAGLRNLMRIYLVEIERGDRVLSVVPSEEVLQGGDRLIFAGETDAITDLLRIKGIVPSTSDSVATLAQTRGQRRLVEVVVSPRCECIGQSIRGSRFRDRYGAVVLAVARNGERVKGGLGRILLTAGDTLLLEVGPTFVSRMRQARDFLLINDMDTEAPDHRRAWLAWTILALMVLLAASELISMLNASLIGAALMLLTGCINVAQAQRSLDLPVLITIAGSFALGAALAKTGVAALLATGIVSLGQGEAWISLVLIYIAVSLLTEVVTNNAAALLALPVGLDISAQAGVNPEAFVVAIMFAASASFMTPIGYQTNLMVYGPGGYRFADFFRVGLPMNLVAGIAALTGILIWFPL
jgi:di/tricarboxylate transporter